MVIRIVQLTSIITVMLVVLMGVAFARGCETHHFAAFWNAVQLTSCFLLIVGLWHFVRPPHRALSKKSNNKSS